MVGVSRFPLPGLEEQMALSTKYQLDTLLYCPDAWALRHRFINQDTGEVIAELQAEQAMQAATQDELDVPVDEP